MASMKERVSAKVEHFRARHQSVDHLVRTAEHYNGVKGNALAGAITFFGFLSFFPILALAFFMVGLVSQVYDARAELVRTINTFLPGIVGGGEGEIPLRTFEQNAAAIGVIGVVGVLYSGLGWLSGMRDALTVVFEMPEREQPNFLVGKLRDTLSLFVIGLVLIVSVGLSGLLAGFSKDILDLLGLEDTPVTTVFLWLVVHGLGIAATTGLFLAIFRLLVDPAVPRRSLLSGAILGGIGFEVLKTLSVFLIGITKQSPAFQAFGIALILVVWINYFSRVVIMSAAYAYTSPAAVEQRTRAALRAPGAALGNPEEGGIRPVDVHGGEEAHLPHPDARAARPLARPAPGPLPPVSDELDPRSGDLAVAGSHRAAAAGRSRPGPAVLAVLGLVAAAAAAVAAWRRSTH